MKDKKDYPSKKNNPAALPNEILLSEEDINQLYALAAVEGIVIHKDGVIVEVNEPLIKLLAYEKDELINHSVFDFIAPEFFSLVEEKIQKENTKFYEISIIKKDGSLLQVEIQGRAIKYKGEDIRVSIIRDLTKKKQIEQALSESETKYQKAFQNVPSAVYLSTLPEGKLVEVNKAFEKISGYSRDELIGKTVEELKFYISPEDRETLLKTMQKDGKLSEYEIFYRIKSGEHRLCSVNAEPAMIGQQMYLIGNISDITDHRKAQLELKASEERNRHLVENLPIGTFISTRSSIVKYLNANTVEIIGFTSDEILSMPGGILDRVHPDDQEIMENGIDRLFETGVKLNVEVRITIKQDNWIWLHFRSNTVKEYDGEPCLFGVVSNITARKRSEQKILESEAKFRAMVETSPDGVTTTDLDGNITYVSDRIVELHGYDHKDELLGINTSRLIAPEERDNSDQIIMDTSMTGKSRNNEITLLRKDGASFDGELSISALTDENGKPYGFMGITRDITERKQIENALIKSEERYRLLIENIPYVTWTADAAGRTEFISSNVEKIIGYPAAEIIKNEEDLWFGLIHRGDLERVAESYKALIDKGTNFDEVYRIKRKDGKWIWLRDKAKMTFENKNKLFAYGVLSEITESKLAEEALRESEASSRALLNATTEIEFLLDKDYNFLTLNEATVKSFGQSLEMLIGTNAFANLPPEIAKERKKRIDEVSRTGKPMRFEDQNGQKWFDNSIYPVQNSEGEITRFAVYANDITERKNAEEALSKSELKFSSAFYNSPLVMAISNLASGEFITVNDAVEATFGYRKEEVIGRSVVDLGIYLFPENRMEILSKLKDGHKIQRLEIEVRKKNGDIIEVEMSASLMQLEDVPCMLSIIEDVSIKKQTERELQTYQNTLRSMAAELVSVEDKEKRKIAEYLHDNLGQSLALARIKTGKLLIQPCDENLSSILKEIENDLADAINYTQSVIYELSPPILYELGLLEALKWKLDDFEKKHGIKSRLTCSDKFTKFKEDSKLILFRTITELLNNVAKHANASLVKLEIAEDPDKTIFTLSDNGSGFNQDLNKIDYSKEQKFGLFSIKESLKKFDSNLEITSSPGKGSTITFFVPLNKNTRL
jgi:PAS domain S-box-containing protein